MNTGIHYVIVFVKGLTVLEVCI